MEINERVKVESKTVVILNYDEALDWCVRNIDSWEASWLAEENPMGWEWIEGLGSQWLVPSCEGGTGGITEAIWKKAGKMAVTAEEKAALVDFGELTEEISSALDVQIDGDHYKKLAIQPIEYCMKNNLNFIQSSIVKYATRYKDKGGRVDLEKIKHLVDLLIEFEYPVGDE